MLCLKAEGQLCSVRGTPSAPAKLQGAPSSQPGQKCPQHCCGPSCCQGKAQHTRAGLCMPTAIRATILASPSTAAPLTDRQTDRQGLSGRSELQSHSLSVMCISAVSHQGKRAEHRLQTHHAQETTISPYSVFFHCHSELHL